MEVDYEPLPAVSDCRAALAPGAPLAHRGRTSNILIEFRQSYGDVADAFARAPHRASVSLKQHRGGAHSIEGRGALAAYDVNEDRLTLWSSTQLAHEVRGFLMKCSASTRTRSAWSRPMSAAASAPSSSCIPRR